MQTNQQKSEVIKSYLHTIHIRGNPRLKSILGDTKFY